MVVDSVEIPSIVNKVLFYWSAKDASDEFRMIYSCIQMAGNIQPVNKIRPQLP